ncbi:MAG: fibronectin type III domain-containing protein [bacterium]
MLEKFKQAIPNKQVLFINAIILFAVFLAIIWLSVTYIYPNFSKKIGSLERAHAEEVKKVPAVISDIRVATTTASSTILSWKTDKVTDSMINYNVSRDYGIVRDPATSTDHELFLDNLSPDQLYYFKIISTDVDGNQSISNDLSFFTLNDKPTTTPEINKPLENPTPNQTETTNGAGMGEGDGTGNTSPKITQEILDLLNQVQEEGTLDLIESKVLQMASEKAKPPTISGDFAKVEPGVDFAVIRWKTDKESNSLVSIASEDNYTPGKYTISQGNANEMVLLHEVKLQNLRPATTYHFRVASKSSLNLESVSEDSTFRTKSIMPEVFNINVSKIEEEAATIDFSTNIPTSAIIEYTDLNLNVTKLEGSTALVSEHSLRLKGLKFDTYYSAVVKVENEQGEKTVSEPITFTTVKDIIPPVISKVNSESTLYPGEDNKTQTIVSWRSDEPAACQFMFSQGLTVGNEEGTGLQAEEDYTTAHVQVVTEFQSATVYKFWINCHDKTGNKARSDDYTMLTPSKEQSILDVIIKNFEGTFGWLKKK